MHVSSFFKALPSPRSVRVFNVTGTSAAVEWSAASTRTTSYKVMISLRLSQEIMAAYNVGRWEYFDGAEYSFKQCSVEFYLRLVMLT